MQFAVRHARLQPHDQAEAAHLLQHLGALGHRALQLRPQPARLGLHAVQEARRQHHVQHRIGGGAGERVAAEGGAVGAGGEVPGHVLAGQHRAHGEAAGDALGRAHHVRLDARPLVGEQLARASHAGLHFVHAEQVAQEVGGRRAYAALALDGFHEDAGGLEADGVAHGVHVVERHLVEALDPRPETGQVFRVPRRRQHGQRATVEGALEGDDPVALAAPGFVHGPADHLHHALVRLGARVAEKDAVRERGLH